MWKSHIGPIEEELQEKTRTGQKFTLRTAGKQLKSATPPKGLLAH
jgi:hypothetical protein